MDSKFQISPDSIRSIVHKLKQKGADALDSQELFICVTTPGFPEVCHNLGTEWSKKHEKQALERIKKSSLHVPWLLKKQADQPRGATLLVHCARGDIAKVKDIVKKTPKDQLENLRETVDSTKKSALHIAAKEGYQVLVEYLLAEGFNPNNRDRELKNPLHYSCIANAEVTNTILIKKCDILAKDSKGCLAIHYAACGTSSKTVQELLEANPRLTDFKDFTGKTALHYAVLNTTENQIEIIRLLIENGSKVNETDEDGRTALHYASQYGKSRCIPILLKHKANANLKDNLKKTPLDAASNERIKKLLQTYGDKNIPVTAQQQKEFEEEFKNRTQPTENQKRMDKMKGTQQENGGHKSNIQETPPVTNKPVLGGDINQVSTWLRQKLFVLLKKLQESGVKAQFHVKRPYIFTGSWLENVDSIQDLYTIFGEVGGPEVAMRVFNVLCPFEKKLPTGLGKLQAMEGFFGESWFGTKPIEEIKKTKGEDKLRRELAEKNQTIDDLKIQLASLQGELNKVEGQTLLLNDELRQYKKMQEDVRKEKVRSAQQYSQILKLTNENQELKKQVAEAYSGDDEVEKLNKKLGQLKARNQQLTMEMEELKSYEAAARRKCGKMFLKALQNPEKQLQANFNNLYDDDSIVRLYESLEGNPPSLLKRLQAVDRNGDGKLNSEEFTVFLERLRLLPQDVLALNRIVGFVSGRKHLSFEEFKDILQQRPQLRVQWEKKLILKLKQIIEASEVGSVEKLFELLDMDSSGSISLEELRTGLESYNIFINQADLSNLYSLLDTDKSGSVSIQQFRSLLGKQGSGKALPQLDPSSFKQQEPSIHSADKSKAEIDTDKQVEQQNEGEFKQGEANEEDHQTENNNEDQNDNEDQNRTVQRQNNDQGFEEQQVPEQHEDNAAEEEARQLESINMETFQGDQPDPVDHNEDEEANPSSDNQEVQEEANDEIGLRVTGIFKIQLRFCENLLDQEELQKVAILFEFGKEKLIKVGDLAKKKWEIAVKFQVSNKLESTLPDVRIVIWKNRDFQESNYLGQVVIDSKMLMETPDEWVINGSQKLQAGAYEKEVTGSIGVQARWMADKGKQEEPQ